MGPRRPGGVGAAAATAASDQFMPGAETTKERWRYWRRERQGETHMPGEAKIKMGNAKAATRRVQGVKETNKILKPRD